MNSEQRAAITESLLASGRYLDQGDFASYLSLFTDDGEYQLVSKVPEIDDMTTWIDLDKTELQNLLDMAPRHLWNNGLRTHQISPPSFRFSESETHTVATVSVFRTCSEGTTSVYAVGHYHDCWTLESSGWRLKKRIMQLATRNLAPPSALPL
jgi:3-phenylpropionate/cinnamic acid dioxygenase small subunit